MCIVIFIFFVVFVVCIGWLFDCEGVEFVVLVIFFGFMLVFGFGYIVLLLKLSWCGLGELDVVLIYSFVVVVFGYLV